MDMKSNPFAEREGMIPSLGDESCRFDTAHWQWSVKYPRTS
jgi:hypothetical protein